MNLDQHLRNELKDMPHIRSQTDRDTLRRNVLAGMSEREQRRTSRSKWKWFLPTAFAGAFALFMFLVISPWLSDTVNESADQSGAELNMAMDGPTDSTQASQPEGGEQSVPPSDDDEASTESAGQNESNDAESNAEDSPVRVEEGESESTQESSQQDVPDPNVEASKLTIMDRADDRQIGYLDTVSLEVAIEGMKEKVPFKRYILQPLGLQILIPAPSGDEVWFAEPTLPDRDTVSILSEQEMMDGALSISPITINIREGETLAEVKEDLINTARETLAETGDELALREDTLSDGIWLSYPRTYQDEDGENYQYISHFYITEQDGNVIEFSVGYHEIISEGMGPRLSEVVFPRLKTIK